VASLSYGGLDLGLLLRTAELAFEPVKDASDTDVLYHRWTLDVQTVMSPAGFTLASRTGQTLPGLQGDRLGVSLANLSEFLSTPRRQLILKMADDQVVKCPEDDPQTKQPYVCDPSGTGPTTRAKVVKVYGDKSAIVQFSAVFHTQAGHSNVVLSNRWNMRSAIARDGRSVRTVSGVAVVRPDLMRAKGFNLDQFRQSFVTQVPDNFIRTGGEVLVNEDETELHYWFMDEERTLQLGADGQGCGAVDIRGNFTIGIDCPVRSLGGKAVALLGAGQSGLVTSVVGALFGAPAFPAAAIIPSVPLVGDAFPVAKANFLFQVFGQPDCDRAKMAKLALNIAFDRFKPLEMGRTFFLVSLYLTFGIGVSEQQLVEVRGELLPVGDNVLDILLKPDRIGELVNLATEIKTDTGNLVRSGANPPFPKSGGTRGSYGGVLLSQILHLPGTLPGIPPGSVGKADLNLQ
jgi:hypothetical protein